MKKLLNACLFISFLFGYLEWSRVEHLFIFQAEWDIFRKSLNTDPVSVLHPFTLIPFIGQLLILYSLFQKVPGRIITLAGIACMGILMLTAFCHWNAIPEYKNSRINPTLSDHSLFYSEAALEKEIARSTTCRLIEIRAAGLSTSVFKQITDRHIHGLTDFIQGSYRWIRLTGFNFRHTRLLK
ncbi:MAG: hypothetical protein V9E88_11070 [Ferruginibacter sp.]